MTRVKHSYVPNHKSMRAYMMTQAFGMRAREVAVEIAGRANLNASRYSVQSSDGDGDHLAGSYKVRKTTWYSDQYRNPRTAHEVYSRAKSAAVNEFGGGPGKTAAPRAPLRKAAAAVAAKRRGPR